MTLSVVFFVLKVNTMTNWHGGKGSKRRPEDSKKLDANWEKVFGKKKKEKKDADKTKT